MSQRAKGYVVSVLIVLSWLTAQPAHAGKWVIRWEAKLNVEVELLYNEDGDPYLRGIALPATGKNRAGRAEMRIDGVVVAFYQAPPYPFEIPLDAKIELPKGVKGQEKIKQPFVVSAGYHLIEFFLISIDERGREVRNGEAAASAKFWIEDTQDQGSMKKADEAFQRVISDLRVELQKARDEYNRLKQEQDQESARLTAEQRAKEQAYERDIATYEERIKTLEKQAAKPPIKEGVIVVTGKPGESVTVDCQRDGQLVRQFSLTFTDAKLISDFRIPVGDQDIIVSATFTRADGTKVTLERSTSGQPMKLTRDRLALYFASFPYSKAVKGVK